MSNPRSIDIASILEKQPAPTPTRSESCGKDSEIIEGAGMGMTEEEWEASALHPRNWTSRKRWRNVMLVAVTGLLSTLTSSIFVPASSQIRTEFHETNSLVITLATALNVMGLGLGPFLFAPISELKGRRTAYLISMAGFTAMNLGCALAPNMAGLIVMRCLAGIFGSSGPGLGPATISDLFSPKERGLPMAIYSIGPSGVLGSYIVLLGWRWTFRIMTILVGLNTLSLAVFMSDTYAPAVKERLEATRSGVSGKERKTLRERVALSPQAKQVIIRTFTRPPRMLKNPVCLLFSTYYAYVYVRIGFVSSGITAALTQDYIYRRLSHHYNDNGRPEYRLVLTQLGMIVFPLGLVIWGWTAEARTHWVGPVVGEMVFAYGLQMCFNSIQGWIVDAFFPYSAAAMAAATFLRSITGCLLPIFSDDLFINLGYGWGGTLLALVSIPAVPAPFILFLYGKQLRERFKFEPVVLFLSLAGLKLVPVRSVIDTLRLWQLPPSPAQLNKNTISTKMKFVTTFLVLTLATLVVASSGGGRNGVHKRIARMEEEKE
ncbi:MFS polyamine transporter [Pseudohyphozyma bogoriensis]|nr:MFS polyamine transporter [Pseudohyphozyma bogoriensis]